MDPLSVIGLVGNICTFLDFGYKLISKAKEIRSLVSGSTALNDELDSEARRLQVVTAGLQMPDPVGRISDQERALQQLTMECNIISSDIMQLISELKTRDPDSIVETFVTAFRNFRKSSTKDKLQSKLDRCRSQLSLQIMALMRTESKDRLNELIARGKTSNRELYSINENIKSLQRSFDEASYLNSATTRSLLELMEEYASRMKQIQCSHHSRPERNYREYEQQRNNKYILDSEPSRHGWSTSSFQQPCYMTYEYYEYESDYSDSSDSDSTDSDSSNSSDSSGFEIMVTNNNISINNASNSCTFYY